MRARIITLGLAATIGLWGQPNITPRGKAPAAAPAKLPQSNIRVDTNLVLVPVTVCDPNNQPVTGLEKEHFRIFDDKVEQTITHFAMDDEPLAVGLVFDTSGSMGTKLRARAWPPRRSSGRPIPKTSFSWWSSTTSRAWWSR